MKEVTINGNFPDSIPANLINNLGCIQKEKWAGNDLQVKNGIGNGTIKTIPIDRGITLLFWDLYLNEELLLHFKNPEHAILLFMYVMEGGVSYKDYEKLHEVNPYQNSIIANPSTSSAQFTIPSGKLKLNCVVLDTKKFQKKKQYNPSFFSSSLQPYFQSKTHTTYSHFGYLNLKIADILEQIHKDFEDNDIHNIAVEGYIHILLAQHLKTHRDYENRSILPNMLTVKDVDKIYKLSRFIHENLSDKITISCLVNHSGLNANKLQHCFRMLYNASVNEYIREKKLEIALESLRNNEYSISEIVYKIGWKSKSYFSKTFAKKYGMLPFEYRKKHNAIANYSNDNQKLEN